MQETFNRVKLGKEANGKKVHLDDEWKSFVEGLLTKHGTLLALEDSMKVVEKEIATQQELLDVQKETVDKMEKEKEKDHEAAEAEKMILHEELARKVKMTEELAAKEPDVYPRYLKVLEDVSKKEDKRRENLKNLQLYTGQVRVIARLRPRLDDDTGAEPDLKKVDATTLNCSGHDHSFDDVFEVSFTYNQ